MSIIGDLAAFVGDASAARLPALDRDILRRHVVDAVIAGVAGAQTSEAAALRRLAPDAHGAEAVALAAAIVRHTEVDDIHLPSCTTPSSVAVSVALSLVASGEVSADTLASAIWVGTELVVRFGMAIDGPALLHKGVWPTSVAAPLGAAAVAARLWGLNKSETESALSLALMLTAGRVGKFSGPLPGRWIVFIAAVAEGLRAAHAARQGFCGDAALLDGPWLTNAQGLAADLTKLTTRLGETSVYPELSLKPFCTARQALGATQALIELLDEGLNPRAIESIRVSVPPAYAGMISQPIDPANRTSGFVSAGFQMGLAAHRRDSLWDLNRASAMIDPAVLDFARRVRVEADPTLQVAFPRHWPATIEVVAGGATIERRIMAALGDPERRLGVAETADKARRILEPLLGQPKAREVAEIANQGLDDAPAQGRLAAMFAAAVRGR